MPRQSGILASHQIQGLFEQGALNTQKPFDKDQIQPASLDLRLGERAFRVRASFLPRHNSVESRLSDMALHEIDLRQGAVLETGCVYVVELLESLDLPQTIAATANPKSSTGRIDVFTRVIVDRAQGFDQIPIGYKGKLYLEVSPQTFPILVRTGSRLSQIRFRQGACDVSGLELVALQAKERLVDEDNPDLSQGVSVSIDLIGENGLVGYRAKKHTGLIDVDKKQAADILDYWEPLFLPKKQELILDPGEFYILVSKESVHVPPQFAAEMLPFDPLVGEFRAHYAGFFDPGFGHSQAGGKGSRAVLEVRSREVPFLVEHGQTVARLNYQHMLEIPKTLYGAGSNYQGQKLKLSKHFIQN